MSASGARAGRLQRARALLATNEFDAAPSSSARAAANDVAPAQVLLARLLLHGVAGAPDPTAAVAWLERAEAAGDADAACDLASIALGGVALSRDARIDQRVSRAVAAGVPGALRAAAIHFGRKPHADDQALCRQLLARAAQAGDAVASQLLAARDAAAGAVGGGDAGKRAGAGAGAVDGDAGAEGDRDRAASAALPRVSAAAPWFATPPDPRQLDLGDALQPPPAKVLATAPRVSTVDALLSADECRLLIATARPLLRASRAVAPDSGEAATLPLRTSSDCSLDPLQEDLALRVLQLRLCAAAGVDLVHAEQLVVLRYLPGQEYRPHRDYLPDAAIARDRPQAGNRRRTLCVYLNDVEGGGGTAFPAAGITVEPRAGRAVVFDNLRDDGQPDADSVHAGLPVTAGEKWLATLWLRERPYRAF